MVDIEAEWELRNSTLRRDPRYVQQSLTSVLNDPRVRARSLACSRSRARLQARTPSRRGPSGAVQNLSERVRTTLVYRLPRVP